MNLEKFKFMHEIASKMDLHENLEEQNCESAGNEESDNRRCTELVMLLGNPVLLLSVERSTLVSIARISAFFSLLLLFLSLICSRATSILIV